VADRVMALLAATTLGRRRARQLVAAGLVLLLAVFGVEAAVHSVHHALGSDPVACPTASMAAHLDGTETVSPTVDLPVHQVGAVAATSDPRVASLRSLDASHPRAPPAPLV
jgi:disulfide bond formation protein DsbB